MSTLGIDSFTQTLSRLDTKFKVTLWDTAGQERFRGIAFSFYKKADAIILSYDVTSRHSFSNCKNWLKSIRIHANKKVLIFLVGNKIDLEEQREVSF